MGLIYPAGVIVPLRKRKAMSECLVTQVVEDTDGKTHFSPGLPRVQWWGLYDCRRGRLVKRQIRISKGIKGIEFIRKPTHKLLGVPVGNILLCPWAAPRPQVLSPHSPTFFSLLFFAQLCVWWQETALVERECAQKTGHCL